MDAHHNQSGLLASFKHSRSRSDGKERGVRDSWKRLQVDGVRLCLMMFKE